MWTLAVQDCGLALRPTLAQTMRTSRMPVQTAAKASMEVPQC